MYQENLERERREEEEKRRADEQKKAAEREQKEQENSNKVPPSRAEMILKAKRNSEAITFDDANYYNSKVKEETTNAPLNTTATLEDLVDYMEDEL